MSSQWGGTDPPNWHPQPVTGLTDQEITLLVRMAVARERDHPRFSRPTTRPPLPTAPGLWAVIGAGTMLVVLVLVVGVVAYAAVGLGWR